MKTFKDLLTELNACKEAVQWAGDMTIEEVVETCHRGDWLLWLAQNINIGLQPMTLAKAHCANTVRHLMKDKRSIKAVDIAISFGEGKATKKELDAAYNAAADAAYAAASAAYATYSAANAAYATYASISAANAAANAAAYAAASAAAAYATYSAANAAAYAAASAAAARKENQQLTADICREHIGKLIIDKVNKKHTEVTNDTKKF